MIGLTEAPADTPEVLFLGEAPHNSYVEGALSTAFRLTKLHSVIACVGGRCSQPSKNGMVRSETYPC